MIRTIFLFSFVSIVHGQLSPDELFTFYSKYSHSDECNEFSYDFRPIPIFPLVFNQLRFDCDSSTLILRNLNDNFSSLCVNETESLRTFRVLFRRSSLVSIRDETKIEVNQILLRGIELTSLDDFIHRSYSEHGSFRSQYALMINVINSFDGKTHHIALATNRDLTFIIFRFDSNVEVNNVEPNVDLIFPNENFFSFNRSNENVWRIDEGFVRSPKALQTPIHFQVSKLEFTLFANESFVVYGTQGSPRGRLSAKIDKTTVACTFNYILRCRFPILPANIDDDHRPQLKIFYGEINIYNKTISLNRRTRLNDIPRQLDISNISAFQVNLNENLCQNSSLKSVYEFILHVWKEDANGTAHYVSFVQDELPPVDCGATVPIGREVLNLIQSISIRDILTVSVDLIHRWYGENYCQSARTRVTFQ